MTLAAVANGGTVSFNGRPWLAQSANKSDSLMADGSEQLIFRTRAGENCTDCGDTSRRVRSEIYSGVKIPAGPKLRVYGTLRRSGPLFQTEWNSVVQAHADDFNSGSPTFQVGTIVGSDGVERVVTSLAWKRQTDTDIQYGTITGPAFSRDTDHSFDLSFIDGYGAASGGYLVVNFDGSTIANYYGPLGYCAAQPATTYLKFGDHAGVDTDGHFPGAWNQTTILKKVTAALSV